MQQKRQARLLSYLLLLFGLLPLAATGIAAASETKVLRLQVHDSVEIGSNVASGLTVQELSGLAWDEDEQLLYAVSDKGRIFHFYLRLEATKIAGLRPVFATQLTNRAGEAIVRPKANAEGLTALKTENGKKGDTELLIMMEGGPTVGPTLERFTPRGQSIGAIDLPQLLGNVDSYRDDKDRLESVTYHPQSGVLVAPEKPLKGQARSRHTIFSLEGKRWSFDAIQPTGSHIKAIEVAPDGNLLILERTRYGSAADFVVRTRYLDFQRCEQGSCTGEDPVVASEALPTGNFEGLTRISQQLYLMVSDAKKNDPRPTVFLLFSLY